MAKFIIISLLFCGVLYHAEAAMITVTTASDVVNSSDGVTSLREAISEANSLEGMDTITFSPDLNGRVINLLNDELRIKDHLTINGLGRDNLTINNGDSYEGRIFYVSDNDNENVITVVFNDLRISNGITNNITHGGAGIFNWENMEVNRCAIVGCKQQIARGGAIHNIGQNAVMVINNSLIDNNLSAVGGAGIFNDGGTLTLNSCTVSDNHSAALEGGGIFNFNGTCIINSCHIEGNKVLNNGAGGGIYNYNGTCKIFNSNIASNEVNDRGTVSKVSCGGGLYNNKDGLMMIVNSAIYRNKAIAYNTGENIYSGGIVNFGEMSISNSTVSENSANAVEKSASYCGGIHNIGNLYIWNCTIVNNTAGTAAGGIILEQGMLQMANSIVANNTSVLYNDFYKTSTNNKFLGKNIIEDGSFTGTGILNVDPKLGPLANNGGSTLTHALLKGSPAIDAGENNFTGLDDFDMDGDGVLIEMIPFDQRGKGFIRVYNSTVDLGALEYVGSAQGSGQIAVNPDMLHFDTVITERPYILSIFVKNKGTSDLKVTEWEFSSGTSNDFSFITEPASTAIVPNDSFEIEVKYLTHDTDIDTGSLVIMSDDPDNPIFNVPIKGIGKTLAPQILVQPDSINFKDVILGQTVTMEVRIVNTGSSDLIISDILISSGSSSAFSASVDHSGFIVKPGDKINFNVVYNPKEVGADTGTITISSNDPDQPSLNIQLSGNGVPVPVAEIEVIPMNINFNTVYIGQTESRHITIRNIGTDILTVSEIAFSATSDPDYSITSGFSATTIPVGESVQIEVMCDPEDSGTMTASLLISSNDESKPVTIVTMTGYARELPMPVIEVSSQVLDFGTLNVGQSRTMDVWIRNVGNTQLNVASISFGSETSSSFTITSGTDNAVIDPVDSISVSVTYHTINPGNDHGILEIISDDPNNPVVEIALEGLSVELPAPKIVTSTDTLNFHYLLLGQAFSHVVSIKNGGTADLTVSGIGIAEGSSTAFSIISGSTSAVLVPDDSLEVGITYEPTADSSDSGALKIISNDPKSPFYYVSLIGRGIVVSSPLKPLGKVAAGYRHTVRLLPDSTVIAIGINNNGQCDVENWTGVIDISANLNNTVGLLANGTVVATGDNNYKQCNVNGWQNIIAVSAGEYHTIGLKPDGTVVAVGSNNHNQCEVDTWTDIIGIAAGRYHTIGVRSDGTVLATGYNNQGQCNVSTWSNVKTVSAGSEHSVGLRHDGTVVHAGFKSDGLNDSPSWNGIVKLIASDYTTLGLKDDSTVVAVGRCMNDACDVSQWTGIVEIAAGCYHNVALKADGTIVARGVNNFGQCMVDSWVGLVQVAGGYGFTVGIKYDSTLIAAGNNTYDQCEVSTYSGIVQIAAGYNHCACLNDLGRVIGIGNNSDGQCDFNSWFNIKDISARFKHTVGLMNNGRVVAVGNNDYNQCEVDSWSGITAIAAGWGHTVGLRSDGTVITTGYNYSGQCDVSGWSGITQICSGYDHTVGLKADGTVVAAGSGTKCKVESWKDIIAISAGSAFTVGLKSDGTVVAAGNGGECDVGSWTGIIGISAGIRHTIGWKADGTVVIAGEHTPLRNWDITPSPNWPIRISPQHQSVENVLPQIFKWYPEPTAAKYALQVSESPDFSNLQIDKKNIIDTSYLVSTLDYETNYFWRINATNENGTSNWTPARSFTTQMLSTPEEPVAAFSENPTVGTAPLTVAFTNQSTGDIVSYSWDFGDGTAESTVQNPTHTYTSSGVYDVRLIAHGPVESDTIIKNSLITVQAQVPQYQITISSGGNGTVSPSGVLTVSQGSSVSVTAIPSVGYHFLNWNVSAGITITENGSTGIFTISGNGTIQTNFSPNTYTITVNETGNGTVSPPGDNTVTYGSDLTISAVADAGYHFVKWTATSGITVENDTAATTTIKNINMPGTVTANFAINQHKITILTSGNGTTNPAGNITVNYGNSVSIQAIADTGYHFVKWNISGSLNVSDPGNPVILIDNITSNGSITALFSSDTLPGNILIDSISAQAKVYLYATNSWTGKVVLTGPGIIKSLKPGIYRLCVINDNKRSFYKTVSVAENTTTYIHASIADAVPLIFTTKAQVLDDNNMPINLNPAGSAIMDDIDKDGITELIIASQSGIFTIYKKIDGYSISKTFSLTLNSNDTVNCIRIADLEYDNTPDLIVGLNTGRMLIADTNGSVTGTLYTTSTGLTGFDFIDYNKDSYPDILLGFADGSIKVAQSTGNLIWNSPSTLNSSVNSIATPIFMDLDGNGKPDIISGNGSGEVNWFSDTGTFSFMAKGSINSGGIPLKLSSNTSLSTVYNDGTALPGVVTTDGSGNIFKVQSVICGDINNDGIVDILDLQQMGIHWGTIATDSVWSGQVNLNLTPGNDGVQVIDILDLQALGKSWGMVR